ncbi:RICIN domain-containing protein [Streptomyces sp. MBT65]|uniref:RICIN domain-containing protein n=1 Tax=Streptomyces sp. MBT65 TaxID=1488395 RepID=UPI0027DAB37D|nr:RICIN domain-containing protein [Streptomyces sp. MBT65]
MTTSAVALAVLAGLAVQPGAAPARSEPASDSYPWYEDTTGEQLRQDQCLMADVLRLGGTSMAATAQDGLNQTPEKLRVAADRKNWEKTPLAVAYEADKTAASKESAALSALQASWKKPLAGLATPDGFTETGFHWPPGTSNDGQQSFYEQTGLTSWISDRYWKTDSDFYDDETPAADEKTLATVDQVGTPRYGQDPSSVGRTRDEFNQALAEHAAFEWMHGGPGANPGADDARIFLASGGFPRTAPQPGTPEYRIAVEDVKSRFAACGWRDPLDPNGVLDDITSTAAGEWQQEIVSQTTQRNQILDANKAAVDALTKGTKALGEMLGHSWIADHATRWQDYWSAGGIGYIGDAPLSIEIPGATGKCLDVEGGATANGTAIQVYTCGGGPAQEWRFQGSYADGYALVNTKSQKCLEVAGGKNADGTKIQIYTCNGSKAQQWDFDVRAAGVFRNAATDKCLNLPSFDNSKNSSLLTCNSSASQKLRIVPKGHTGDTRLGYPDKAQFTQAKTGVTAAQTGAKTQLAVLKAQLAAAQKSATASDAALQTAYSTADANGAPRGRGLLVGQQKAQVTKGTVAALTALVKAGETAEAATRAAAGDSATIAQRALAQAAQAKAEFRKEAAKTAEFQAKAAADAAKVHRDNAKKDKETAEAKLTVALAAEGDAKAAAADAHAKRLTAEAEEKTAKAEKETAAAEQAEAAEHRKNAEAEATKAGDAKGRAESAEKTAQGKRDDAVKSRDHAKAMRDDAWDARQEANAKRAKADAKDAYADKISSGSAAEDARAAANEADKAAGDAETAADNASSEARAATEAAAAADAAATRAEAAAKRARAASDAAQADKLKADAAVKTATAAVADAIKASQDAAAEAKAAVTLADEAEQHAKDAKSQALAANAEAVKAIAAAAKAVGFAHVTAQAAVDAAKSAEQVAAPANDAVQLGSPYVDTDSAAGLVVLTGQASKSIAEQQQAVAQAHAANAAVEAQAAKNLADQAQGDSKEAYQHAANAAQYAADARTYSKEALGYAADAATAASKAAASLARTIDYDQQATVDAAAADKAAGNAEGYAKDARASADQAELDASAARAAAARAEQDAKDARAAATRADTAATEAEQAAKDADKYSEEAQQAATEAEAAQASKNVKSGSGTGVGGVFSVIDEIRPRGEPERLPNECHDIVVCDTMVYIAHFDAVVSFYVCGNPDVPATPAGCPSDDTHFLKTVTVKDQTKTVKISTWDATVDVWKGIAKSIKGDFTGCYHKAFGGGEGSASDCFWAASWLPLGGPIGKVADAIRAVDAAMRTGIGVADALKALRALDIDAEALASIERSVNAYEEARMACRPNSFPGTTHVVMADGTTKEIRYVRTGDAVLATDPGSGRTAGRTVTDTVYTPDDTDFADITIDAGRSRITATQHHPFWSPSAHRWVDAGDLEPGQTLRSSDGGTVTVVGVHRYQRLHSAYNLGVADIHTYYVLAGTTPVLVHNTFCPVGFADLGGGKLESPGGLIYGFDKKYGTKIDHVLAHTVPDASKVSHTVFIEHDPAKVLALVDEAWAMQSKAIKDPADAFRFVFPMGRTIGTRGEKYLQIAVNPQTKEILSAYPVAAP